MSTLDDLKSAFAGESQANRKYLAFAQKAEAEGKPQIAKLFRAAAEAETVHAHAHLRAMNGVGDTARNVQAAIEGEHYEFANMYPQFLEAARKEGNKEAARSFEYALAVEKVHHRLYSQAAEALREGRDLPAARIFVCPVCGNTEMGTVPDRCVVCGVPGSRFVEIR